MTAQPTLFSRLTGLVTALRPAPKPTQQQATRGLLDRLFADFDSKAATLASGVASGRLSVDEWDSAMRALIRQQHLAAAVVGSGGLDRADVSTYATAQARVNQQMTYLEAWTADLRAGKGISETTIANRASLYGRAAGATADQVRTEATGLPTLPQYPRDGQTRCLTRCLCELRIVPQDVVNGSYDVYWLLHAKESCPDCVRISRLWNPLRIRNGKLV